MSSSWSEGEIKLLKKAAVKYPRSIERNQRWKLIAKELNRGKRECHEKYKQLKNTKKDLKRDKQQGNMARGGKASTLSSDDDCDHNDEDKYLNEKDAHSSCNRTRISRIGKDGAEDSSLEERKLEIEAKIQYDNNCMEPKKSPQMVMEEMDDFDDDFNAPVIESVRKSSTSSIRRFSFQKDIESEEESEEEEEQHYDDGRGRPVSLEEAKGLKALLFGTRKPQSLDATWAKQGFFFNKSIDLKYGLVQLKGGPCGVLAAVQAYVLLELLFNKELGVRDWRNPSSAEQTEALIKALVNILWQAGESKREVLLCVHSPDVTGSASYGSSDGYRPDGFLDKMLVHKISKLDALQDLISNHIGSFMAKSGPGVGMVLCSLILTRGLQLVEKDIDSALGETATLIGNHNYAAQELVNLLIVGYASSNVFDGTQKLGGDETEGKDSGDTILLRGIKSQSKVGFLTLYEHYEYMKVGANLKTPASPIWVVCSESHYSVLFSDSHACLNGQETEFDLYYFDQLGNQDEEYRLTVDSNPDIPVEHCTDEKRLVSPIEECIRTKWQGATVDWNGSDPLL